MMRSRKGRVILLIITTIIIIAIWGGLTYIPRKIVTIAPSKVSSIKIFDGNTGKSIIITDKENIEHIIGNLNGITFKKDKVSLGKMGYSFKTTIYKNSGAVYKEFMINSTDTIRKDPFFYKDSTKSIDYDYIRNLIDSQKPW